MLAVNEKSERKSERPSAETHEKKPTSKYYIVRTFSCCICHARSPSSPSPALHGAVTPYLAGPPALLTRHAHPRDVLTATMMCAAHVGAVARVRRRALAARFFRQAELRCTARDGIVIVRITFVKLPNLPTPMSGLKAARIGRCSIRSVQR